MAELYGVPSHEVDGVWEAVRPWVAAACLRGIGAGYNETDIYQYLLDRDMQLWLARDGQEIIAVGITEIVNYPRRRICNLTIGTGKRREQWQHFRHIIEVWAKEQGCSHMSCLARNGWRRVFNDYKSTHTLLEKEL